jgi:hypothetical protein
LHLQPPLKAEAAEAGGKAFLLEKRLHHLELRDLLEISSLAFE